jgi:hypothetical protein
MGVASDRQIISVHTASGVQLYQWGPEEQLGPPKWTREQRQTSTCDITVPSVHNAGLPLDITPWLHWVSVWDSDGQELYWTGPIQRVTLTKDVTQVSARDVSALMTRTRCPITKRWEAADPSRIAGELWAAMLALHGIPTRAVQRVDPRGDPFDFEANADSEMMADTITRLVEVGLYWTVVSGVPVLGPAPLDAVAALGEHDFVGDSLSLVRDGSESFNDVLVRGADNLARSTAPMGGLRLQTIASLDDMFGVSNVAHAARQYARYTASIKDSVVLSEDVVLHPDVPLTVQQLIPSARVTVDAFGTLSLMEVTKVTVAGGDPAVGLQTVNDDLPELMTITDQRAAT